MSAESVFTYWGKSLEFFKKDSLNIFVLATLNTFYRSGKILLYNFWWLFVIDILLSFTTNPLLRTSSIFTSVMVFYVMFLTVRPSLEAKNSDYYLRRYTKGIFAIIFFSILQGFLSGFVLLLLYQMGLVSLNNLIIINTVFSGLIHIMLFVPIMFFFLDSNLSFKAFFRAWKQCFVMIKNFLPIVSTIAMTLLIPHCLLAYTHLQLADNNFILSVILIISKIVSLLTLANLAVLYTRLKHEHFKLLFE